MVSWLRVVSCYKPHGSVGASPSHGISLWGQQLLERLFRLGDELLVVGTLDLFADQFDVVEALIT